MCDFARCGNGNEQQCDVLKLFGRAHYVAILVHALAGICRNEEGELQQIENERPRETQPRLLVKKSVQCSCTAHTVVTMNIVFRLNCNGESTCAGRPPRA